MDATHEVVIVNILTALNVTILAEDGPPNGKKMKRGRRWVSSKVAPFAANLQFQRTSLIVLAPDKSFTDTFLFFIYTVLTCSDPTSTTSASASPTQIRIILNDGVVDLTGIEGCPQQKDGLCPLDTFIASQKKLLEKSDWDWTCHGNWTVPEGDAWQTITGDPPSRE